MTLSTRKWPRGRLTMACCIERPPVSDRPLKRLNLEECWGDGHYGLVRERLGRVGGWSNLPRRMPNEAFKVYHARVTCELVCCIYYGGSDAEDAFVEQYWTSQSCLVRKVDDGYR